MKRLIAKARAMVSSVAQNDLTARALAAFVGSDAIASNLSDTELVGLIAALQRELRCRNIDILASVVNDEIRRRDTN